MQKTPYLPRLTVFSYCYIKENRYFFAGISGLQTQFKIVEERGEKEGGLGGNLFKGLRSGFDISVLNIDGSVNGRLEGRYMEASLKGRSLPRASGKKKKK